MVPSLIKGAFALALVVVGAVLIAGSRERTWIHRYGLETDAVVREIYAGDPDRSAEVWLEYTDREGQSHWLHGKLASAPHRNAAVRIKYHPQRPARALLASEPNHYDLLPLIFGAYFVGYGLFSGYRLWKS